MYGLPSRRTGMNYTECTVKMSFSLLADTAFSHQEPRPEEQCKGINMLVAIACYS